MKLTITIKRDITVYGGWECQSTREDGAPHSGMWCTEADRISAWLDMLAENHDITVLKDERGQG